MSTSYNLQEQQRANEVILTSYYDSNWHGDLD